MPTLLEKIEQNAEKRLQLPGNKKPSDELSRYRRFLKVENHRLHMQHRAGISGREVCRARAHMFDQLIIHILQGIQSSSPELESLPSSPWALVATGGYGRAELNPLSDIDIMFLFHGEMVSRGKPNPFLATLNEGLLLALWDLGLKVGHSVRSIFDCIQLANREMKDKTSLIESRLIYGNSELFKIFNERLRKECILGHDQEYIAARMKDQKERRAKYGNSPTMQEPNLKSGCGGLRDYQNLLWMALFKYDTRSLTDLVKKDFMSSSERRRLRDAYNFLLRVRNELHHEFGKAIPAKDVLTKAMQPAVALHLGYTDRSISLRIEKFMRDLYLAMRNIFLLTRMLEERMALVEVPDPFKSLMKVFTLGGKKPAEKLHDGFRISQGVIRQSSARAFRDQPRRLMRVFLHAQQRGLKLHADLRQLIRNSLHLVNRKFLQDHHVSDTFMEILNQRGNVAPMLRAMHEVDFLGKYIPEFGRLTCLVQHEFYHVYAADEHVLVCIEQLDRVWEADKKPHANYSEMFQDLDRPAVLYLALLLHDVGKASPSKHGHEEEGALIARKVGNRLNLEPTTIHSLEVLIRYHLLMVQVSQRRDLEDPVVIQQFAKQVPHPTTLNMLTLHTFADAMGTSEKMWNGFKDSLLLTLHDRAFRLTTGSTSFIRAEAAEREELKAQLKRRLPRSFTDEEIKAHFDSLPPRYFSSQSSNDIRRDIQQVHGFMRLQLMEENRALEPMIAWHNEPDRGYTSVKICTWDRARLFTKISGSFGAAGQNIINAQVFSRTDGIVLDTFFVTDIESGGLVKRQGRERFRDILTRVLAGESVDFEKAIIRQKPGENPYIHLAGRIPTRVIFENEASVDYTIIDIETEDRPGLLYIISQKMSDLGLNIALAKVSTEKGAAIDSFYVYEGLGFKVDDPERHKLIGEELLKAINGWNP